MSRAAFAMAIAVACSTTAWATPVQLTHHGRLLDAAGAPLAGTVDLTLRLYDAVGQELHEEVLPAVPVADGAYTVQLGADTTNNPLEHDVAGAAVSVGVQVGTEPELSPRAPIGPVPVAARALEADDAARVGGLTPAQLGAPGTFSIALHSCAWTACMDTPTLTGCPAGKVIAAVDIAASDSQKPQGCTGTNHEDEVRYYCCAMRVVVPGAQ